jgi:hypothetical protein
MKRLTTFLTGVTNPDPLVRRSSSKRRLRTLPIAGLLRRRCQYFRSMRPCSPDNGDRLRKPPFKFHRGLSLTLLLLADLILVVTIVRHNNTRHGCFSPSRTLHYRRGSPDIFPFPSAGREGYLIAVTACYSKTMPNQ